MEFFFSLQHDILNVFLWLLNEPWIYLKACLQNSQKKKRKRIWKQKLHCSLLWVLFWFIFCLFFFQSFFFPFFPLFFSIWDLNPLDSTRKYLRTESSTWTFSLPLLYPPKRNFNRDTTFQHSWKKPRSIFRCRCPKLCTVSQRAKQAKTAYSASYYFWAWANTGQFLQDSPT